MSEPTIGFMRQYRVPGLPNFLLPMDDLRAEGMPVGDLDDAAVERVINAWTVAFRAHVAKKRAQRAEDKARAKR